MTGRPKPRRFDTQAAPIFVLQAWAARWNAEHEIGTKVTLMLGGRRRYAATLSEAWALGGFSPMLMLSGIRGPVDIDSLRVRS